MGKHYVVLTAILTVDLSQRITLAGIIAHPWCTAGQEFIVDTGGVARRTIDWYGVCFESNALALRCV